MRPRARRILLPMMLLVLGVFLLQGCFYIPTFNMTVGGKDVTKSVGDAGSGKPIERGMSTRDKVVCVLGEPSFATRDGRFLVYSWLKRKGVTIYPFCFAASPEDRSFAMTLEFNSQGVVIDFAIEEGYRAGYLWDRPQGYRFTPYRVFIYEKELELQNHPELLERFRAATQRAATRHATTFPSQRRP